VRRALFRRDSVHLNGCAFKLHLLAGTQPLLLGSVNHRLIIGQYFLYLLVTVRRLVLLLGTIILAESSVSLASWYLRPRIGIVVVLEIRPPTFVATFIAVQAILALRVFFTVPFTFSALFPSADWLGLVQLFLDLRAVVSRPVCSFCLLSLVAGLVDDHFAVIIVGGERVVLIYLEMKGEFKNRVT